MKMPTLNIKHFIHQEKVNSKSGKKTILLSLT